MCRGGYIYSLLRLGGFVLGVGAAVFFFLVGVFFVLARDWVIFRDPVFWFKRYVL